MSAGQIARISSNQFSWIKKGELLVAERSVLDDVDFRIPGEFYIRFEKNKRTRKVRLRVYL